MLETNKIYLGDCLEVMKEIDDRSIDLIIADFPYFKVKGDFDFIWDSFDEFLEWVELCAREFKRLLKDNGTLFVYGHAKKIAYKQLIFDKYFNLENSLVWKKKDCQTLRSDFEQSRCFAPVTERILMYSSEVNKTGLQTIMDDYELFKPIRDYFECERKKTRLSYKEINELYFRTASGGGGMASNILTGYKDGWTFPTQEKYEILQKIGICSKPYEQLRQEYEQLRRPFNNTNKYSDVLEFSQEVHITKNYDHETQKPETLTRALTLTCSRKNDLVLVPFAGSGTECVVAEQEGRRYIGIEKEEKYYNIALERIKHNPVKLL